MESSYEKKARKAKVWKTVRDMALGVILVFTLHTFVFSVSVVLGESMEPNFMTGDRVIVERIGSLHVNDVVVFDVGFAFDDKRGDCFMKRVIALPGDEIDLLDGRFYVNGAELPEPFPILKGNERGHWKVSDGHIFVAGDNRPISCDCREQLPLVPLNSVRGRVVLRIWPLSRAGRV